MHWTTDRIRQSFLDFFEERGHKIERSASLIPKGDPTLLFTNAGMVPFKDYFLGLRTPAAKRVADCQKCLRISGKHNDLEAVGRDSYHHTFFEMLGNWSFGDYYKQEAIAFHWELINQVWGIPKERLWATVFRDDDEAEAAWLKLGVLPKERIVRCGEKDNFWEMGETGPCGPCSEIHIDRGAEASRNCPHEPSQCAVNVDGCARYIELGNLVFIQYNRDASGKLTPLPMKHVDTGTGLERVASVLQSIETGRYLGNYDIDTFLLIIKQIEQHVNIYGSSRRPMDIVWGRKTVGVVGYGQNSDADVSYRAIADHARAISFLIADGVIPSNVGPGYVLRRLIRRAVRHGRRIGISRIFLSKVCMNGVVQAFGAAYPDLKANASKISQEALREENRFEETLNRGMEVIAHWRERLTTIKSNRLPGDVAFQLYDTYGFPLDLTQDILREEGIEVDIAGFDRLMSEQRERGRTARRDRAAAPEIAIIPGMSSEFQEGCFAYESMVLGFEADESGRISMVTRETPFYPEGGGQIGDRGVVEGPYGSLLEVVDTQKQNGIIIKHICKLLKGDLGEFERGRRVKLRVDRERRDAAMRNHSATHILHYALREIRGQEVHQAGSLVEPGRLRFDFAHQGPIADADLLTIEEEINARIRENAEVTTDEMAYDDAIKAGALAFFGDKYGDRVRVVRMGDFSVELCGGTHTNRTGDIGLFKLEAESGVAAGVRRIEAFTGQGALEAIRRREKILADIGDQLGARDAQALERLERIIAREKELEKKLRALEQKLVAGDGAATGGAEQVREVKGVKVVTRKFEGVDAKALREIADRLRQKYGSAVVALGADLGDDKVALLVAVTTDLTPRIKAGDLVKQLAPMIGGSGGGRPDFAQAGGRDASKLNEVLARVAGLVGGD